MSRTGDYSLGRICTVVSNQTVDIYIGSTCQKLLSMRLGVRTKDYLCWLNGKDHYRTSYETVKYDDVHITLVDNYPCNDPREVEARERRHVENNKCVNNYVPTRSTKEWVQAHKVYAKQVQKRNREAYHESYLEYDKQKYKCSRKEELLQ